MCWSAKRQAATSRPDLAERVQHIKEEQDVELMEQEQEPELEQLAENSPDTEPSEPREETLEDRDLRSQMIAQMARMKAQSAQIEQILARMVAQQTPDSHEALAVSLGDTASGADPGGSSNENFEGRSGDGFHDNSNGIMRPKAKVRPAAKSEAETPPWRMQAASDGAPVDRLDAGAQMMAQQQQTGDETAAAPAFNHGPLQNQAGHNAERFFYNCNSHFLNDS